MAPADGDGAGGYAPGTVPSLWLMAPRLHSPGHPSHQHAQRFAAILRRTMTAGALLREIESEGRLV